MWSRVLAYQIISDQRAKVLSFIVYDKLREQFVPSAHSPPQILETRTSCVKKDRSIRYQLKVTTVPLGMK